MGTWQTNASGNNNQPQVTKTKYSTQEVADRLEVSIRTVYNLRISGLLTFEQAFDKAPVYFTEEDIAAYKKRIRKGGASA